MRIVVDAFGTDTRPHPDVEGAILAAKEWKTHIILVGPEALIKQELTKHNTQALPIEIVNADDVIEMHTKPADAVRETPNSSIHIGLNLVKNGSADAFVSMGNTGAIHAIAMLSTLKRIQGVKRPALSIIYPIYGKPVIVLDIGANTDSKPEWLAQFAIMGSAYAQNALGVNNPRIALISNGEEETKGTPLLQEANTILRELPLNYIGYIEPPDMHHNVADVVVVDGFIGNIMLKTFEATTRYMVNIIRDQLKSTWRSKIGALLSRPAFSQVRKLIDPSEIGGAPLLGVNGVVIIGHGSSDAKAVKNAIYQAQQAVLGNVIQTIKTDIANMPIGSSDGTPEK
ncbi:MAG: phosphate acyltransferase PlsX [Anaerolineae bacterium]|nr:phosphate acyltransferase PlsX [Anaerolineae bacterium]